MEVQASFARPCVSYAHMTRAKALGPMLPGELARHQLHAYHRKRSGRDCLSRNVWQEILHVAI